MSIHWQLCRYQWHITVWLSLFESNYNFVGKSVHKKLHVIMLFGFLKFLLFWLGFPWYLPKKIVCRKKKICWWFHLYLVCTKISFILIGIPSRFFGSVVFITICFLFNFLMVKNFVQDFFLVFYVVILLLWLELLVSKISSI